MVKPGMHTLFIWKRKFWESKCCNWSLWMTWRGNLSHIFISTVKFRMLVRPSTKSFTVTWIHNSEVPQSCRVSRPLLNRWNFSHNIRLLFKMQSATPFSCSHGKGRYHIHFLYFTGRVRNVVRFLNGKCDRNVFISSLLQNLGCFPVPKERRSQ